MPKGSAAKDEEETFESADSGAAKTYPKQCSALRKGEICMIKGKACKIVEMSTSKTGKHGHAKVHLVAIDIFDGKKYEDICPSTHNMDVPVVKTCNYTLLDINEDGYVSLMDDKTSDIREDLKIPDDDVGKQILKDHSDGKEIAVVVTKAMDHEQITGNKLQTK